MELTKEQCLAIAKELYVYATEGVSKETKPEVLARYMFMQGLFKQYIMENTAMNKPTKTNSTKIKLVAKPKSNAVVSIDDTTDIPITTELKGSTPEQTPVKKKSLMGKFFNLFKKKDTNEQRINQIAEEKQ